MFVVIWKRHKLKEYKEDDLIEVKNGIGGLYVSYDRASLSADLCILFGVLGLLFGIFLLLAT
jgi:hypothetical protein